MRVLRSLIKGCLSLGVSLTLLDRLLLARQKSRLGGRFIRLINATTRLSGHSQTTASRCAITLGISRASGRTISRGCFPKAAGTRTSRVSSSRSTTDFARTTTSPPRCWRSSAFTAGSSCRSSSLIRRRSSRSHSPAATPFCSRHSPADGRVAMNWDELRDLERRGHVVGCHTRTHHRLSADTSPQQLDDEIVAAKADLERRLGHAVEHFCWVGGEERSYSREAAERIRQAGYRYGYMTCSHPCVAGTDRLHLHRTNVESPWPLHAVRLQLCGIADWANAAKRRRVDELTAG